MLLKKIKGLPAYLKNKTNTQTKNDQRGGRRKEGGRECQREPQQLNKQAAGKQRTPWALSQLLITKQASKHGTRNHAFMFFPLPYHGKCSF